MHGPPIRPSEIDFVLCDLDGVVWLANRPIVGAVEAVARIRSTGRRVMFVTNNSMSTISEQESALEVIGISARDDVVTSAQAAAFLIAPDERVLVAAGPGVVEAVAGRGAIALRGPGHDRIDAVVVGLHRDFDFAGLQAANVAIRAGARFIATNDDATFPTPDGPTPGAGSILAAIRTVSEREPVIAGKPHQPMAALVAARCGTTYRPARTLMVGDRASTDGLFAATIGCPFALVRTGVTLPGGPLDAPTEVAVDVLSLADIADLLPDAPLST
jgi:HAD superfamily hydrolase (TIGR01450 family)